MLSFIIIGRNEAPNIPRCLNSVFHVAEQDQIGEYEVIYVDSKSEDNSLDVLAQYPTVHVYQITGKYSVAAGRSVGAKEARGDILFFLDADIELLPGFIAAVLDDQKRLKYDIVRGNLRNIYHTYDGTYLYENLYNNMSHAGPQRIPHASGIFMIKKEVWNRVGGVQLKYVNAFEDLDMGLRSIKKGVWTTYVDNIMGNHYTVSHRENTVMWQKLRAGAHFYRAVLYRDNLFNRHMYPMLFCMDWTMLILIACVVSSCVNPYVLLLYPASCFVRVIRQPETTAGTFLPRMVYYFIRDITTLAAFVFFHPRGHALHYCQVQ